MSLPAISGVEFRAARAATLATFALWLAIGYLPGARVYAHLLRGLLLAIYLGGAIGFVAYVLVRQ